MTNQDTTLTNQYALIAAEFKDMYPYDDMSNWDMNIFKSGYLAATKVSESEINSLKERVAELELTVKKWQENSVDLEYKCLDKNLQIDELQASNNKLREELENTLTSLEESQEK